VTKGAKAARGITLYKAAATSFSILFIVSEIFSLSVRALFLKRRKL